MRKVPANLPKPTKAEREAARKQLARTFLALRRVGRKAKARRG
jgi:hypothetical protein